MGIGMQVLGLIASLSLLVFVHELGHFFFARIFHTRVKYLRSAQTAITY